MAKPVIRDFKCPSGHMTEKLTGETTVFCKCGLVAKPVFSKVRFRLDGSSKDFPTAHARWVKEHENAAP